MAGRLIPAFLSALLLWSLPYSVQAQDRCSSTLYETQRMAQRPRRESAEQFEAWMKSRIESQPQIMAVYTIPVVVHVLHNGTGDVTNISDAQILSQIDVLNKDFNRLNLDASNTPPEFTDEAGSISIDFVLAQRDPEGLATNGITRTLASKSQYSIADQSEFKALSYWPSEDYLNIWVMKFGTNDIGFAQFPASSTLQGLEFASEDRLTDGVVVDYRAFGTSDAGSFPLLPNYNKGRTATHEIGHFLGLRHIWGDVSSCADNDYVSDTPPQTGPTTFCPSHPQVSCSTNKMFMNYMDYTNDVCMNLYTDGQVARMAVVLAESPRRVSLLTSQGATPPVVTAHDLGIRKILYPGTSACQSPLSPEVEFRNYGTNSINSATLQVDVTGGTFQSFQVPLSLSLAPGASTTITIAPIILNPGLSTSFSFTILDTNGGVDGNPENDDAQVTTTAYGSSTLPLQEPFETLPPAWIISNPDNQVGWVNTIAPDISPSNHAMRLEFFNYEGQGPIDWLISPPFDIGTPTASLLRFDIAYAPYPGQTEDALRVYALPWCSTDLSQATLLYDKTSNALATTASTSNPFMPTSNSHWRKSEFVSLSTLSPSTRWQLAFVGRNGYGNNLYLDNVSITENEIFDIGLLGIVSPGIVHCVPNPGIRILVANLSSVPVTGLQADFSLAGATPQQTIFDGIQLNVGEIDTFDLDPIALQPGMNHVSITISLQSGLVDGAIVNNSLTFNTVLDLSHDRGPLKVTFDHPGEKPWRVASPADAQDWEPVETNKENSLTYRSFTNSIIGEESWLVSPILDLTAGTFSLFFDVSYAQNVPADDRLQLVASRDCGVTYNDLLMDRPASTFTDTTSLNEWHPTTNDDWRHEYVNLGTLANLTDVRLAFVVRNDNGNNLFLDNIELFIGDNPSPPVTTAQYQLYYPSLYLQSNIALTFNLDTRQDVELQIIGMQGNLVGEYLLTDALNQTYYFDLAHQTSGLYIFRLLIDNSFSATKVFIGH